MGKQEAYRILGLEPGAGKTEIKKAYAKLIVQYHPEEFPEEWDRIHKAYEVLTTGYNAGNMSIQSRPTVKTPEVKKPETNTVKANKTQETDNAKDGSEADTADDSDEYVQQFENIDHIAEQYEIYKKSAYDLLEKIVSTKRYNNKPVIDKEQLTKMLTSNKRVYPEVLQEDDFLTRLYALIENSYIEDDAAAILKKDLFKANKGQGENRKRNDLIKLMEKNIVREADIRNYVSTAKSGDDKNRHYFLISMIAAGMLLMSLIGRNAYRKNDDNTYDKEKIQQYAMETTLKESESMQNLFQVDPEMIAEIANANDEKTAKRIHDTALKDLLGENGLPQKNYDPAKTTTIRFVPMDDKDISTKGPADKVELFNGTVLEIYQVAEEGADIILTVEKQEGQMPIIVQCEIYNAEGELLKSGYLSPAETGSGSE